MGRAILPVSFRFLEQLFQLPPGYEIVAARDDLERQTVQVLLESGHIPSVDEDTPLPQIQLSYQVDYHPSDANYRKISVTPKIVT